MNIASLYIKIKQILNDSNEALISKGFDRAENLYEILEKLRNVSINRLPYILQKTILEVTEEDLMGVVVLRNGVFNNNRELKNITIPSSVTRIGSAAFLNSTYIENIYIKSTIPPILDGIGGLGYSIIHVPIGSGEAYRSATNWSSYSSRIVDDIEI